MPPISGEKRCHLATNDGERRAGHLLTGDMIFFLGQAGNMIETDRQREATHRRCCTYQAHFCSGLQVSGYLSLGKK
jgi:hypothetical protein